MTASTLGSRSVRRPFFTPASITAHDDHYVISNDAHPGLVLQPTNPAQAEAPVVLAAPGTTGIHHQQNVWKVASPLLTDQIVTNE